MPPIRDRIKEESKIIQSEFTERTVGFITGALGLVAGLAWNDAAKALIEYLFPLSKDGISAKFMYAILVTIVVVLLITFISRLPKKNESKYHQISEGLTKK